MNTRRWLGLPITLVVSLLMIAAVVGAAVAWLGTSSWSSGQVRATADVDIAPLIGTYSSYEVATHTANFSAAYDGGRSAGDAGGDPDAPGAFVDSSRVGEATLIRVTYVAGSAATARTGLLDQVGVAVDTVGRGLERQERLELEGVQEARRELIRRDEADGTAVDRAAHERAGQLVAESTVALQGVRAARASTTEQIEDLQVVVEPLSSTGQRVRASAAASLSAIALAVGALLLAARLPPRRQHRRPDDEASNRPSAGPTSGYQTPRSSDPALVRGRAVHSRSDPTRP